LVDLGGGAQSPGLSDKGLTSSAERQVFSLLPRGFGLLTPPFLCRRNRQLVHHGSLPDVLKKEVTAKLNQAIVDRLSGFGQKMPQIINLWMVGKRTISS
jgi:hypothetical protein